jgi:hypothetical protein
LSLFCPFLGIPFCSVGGPQTNVEICSHESLIFGENFASHRAVPPTRTKN